MNLMSHTDVEATQHFFYILSSLLTPTWKNTFTNSLSMWSKLVQWINTPYYVSCLYPRTYQSRSFNLQLLLSRCAIDNQGVPLGITCHPSARLIVLMIIFGLVSLIKLGMCFFQAKRSNRFSFRWRNSTLYNFM